MTTTKKLPVWRTIAESYVFLFWNWREAIKIGWFPLITLLVLEIAAGFIIDYFDEYSAGSWSILIELLLIMLIMPIVAMAAVPWHRLILMSSRPRAGVLAVGLAKREWRYAGLAIAVYTITTGLMFVVTLLPTNFYGAGHAFFALIRIFHLLAVFSVAYLLAIGLLALPAIAVDRSQGLRGALRMGWGNGWALVLIGLGVQLPAALLGWGLYEALPGAFFQGAWLYGWVFGSNIFYIFVILMEATALSMSYRALGGMEQGEA